MLKNRISALKKSKTLPKNYKRLIVERYPEYDTMDGARLIDRVVLNRTTDVRLTEILEQIAAEHQQSLRDMGFTDKEAS